MTKWQSFLCFSVFSFWHHDSPRQVHCQMSSPTSFINTPTCHIMSYCLRPGCYLHVLYWRLATVWGHAAILNMSFNQILMILCKTVTFCSVHLNHLTLILTIDHFSGVRPDIVWPRAGIQNYWGTWGKDDNSWLLLCSALTDGPYSYI